MELDWLKKKLACSTEDLRPMVDRDHAEISIRRQCQLLGANRSGLYYEPLGESEENLQLMRLLDEQYTRTPFYGSRRMVEWLATQGFEVNRKRVARLMEGMGIEAASLSPESEHWLDWFHIRMCLTVTGRSIIIKVQQLQTGGLVNEIEKIISQLEQQKAS